VSKKPGRGASYRVEFNDAAFAEDLKHNSSPARDAGETRTHRHRQQRCRPRPPQTLRSPRT
jgi:hypothetical protein